ncbi:MAG: T9SS type A sorting domain-containing protein [Bacteroidetes bacterium]|nr:T9SS type A sorting domain-containing protein [Bacteroidota bacterium]
MKSIISYSVVFIVFASTVYSQQNISPNFFDIQKQSLQYFTSKKSTKEDDSWAKYKRWEWFWKQRVTPDGQFPNPMAVYNETVKKQAELKKSGAQILSGVTANWKERGPFGSADGGGAGRVNRVHLNPFFPNDVWAGTAAGGAWKSTDKGLTWKVKTDGIPILGVTDIATVSSDPNVVYIATGDGDGDITSTNVQDHISYSLGVMKSTDGGTTWATTGLNWQTSNARLISRLLVSPTNPQLLLAATSQGIYKSVNGGTTWTITQNGYFMDMEFKPNDASNLYACSGSAIYKSVNEGSTWTKLTTGIPTSIGRIALGVGSANPEMVYALCTSQSNWGFGGFYSSTNAGQTWQLKSSTPNILGLESDGSDPATEQFQGWYDLAIAVSPASSQEIYIGGINIWKTTNGGLSWFCNAHWYGDKGLPYVHADIHDLAVSEENPSMIFSGNDGGVFRTSDKGKTWADLSNGMGIMQFYRIASASVSTDLIIGGAQDNGTNLLKNEKWSEVNDGDGMNCLIDPNNSNILYAGAQEGDISRSTDGGANFPSFINTNITNEPGSWVTPYVFDPTNSKILYVGFINVWKYNPTTLKWSKISKLNGSPLNYLAVAPSDVNYIYAGNEGELSYTSNGGTSWQGITAPQLGNISHLVVHPSSPRRLWLTMSSYTNKKVYESNDAGQTWVDVSAGLPSIPINCIVYQNNSPDRLYVGTEAGVYYRDNDLNQWQQYNDGLPNVIVSDLQINYTANKLLAGTYGRGVWEANLINCTSSATVTVTVTGSKTTLCDGDSVKLTATDGFSSYRWSNGATTQSIYAKEAGEYIVTITDSKGCPASSKPIIIAVSTKKIPTIKGDHTDSTACEGNPITLDIGFGFSEYSLKWSTGDTTRKIKVTQAGVYSVTATNSAGCVGASSKFIVKQGIAPAKPTITMSGDTLISSVANGYQWYVDGLPLAGATSRWFIPPSGTLGKKATVAVFNSGGCSTTSDEYVITVTSVAEQSVERGLLLYPNPARQTITLEATLESIASVVIQITNTLGANVQTIELIPENLQVVENISLKELSAGTYIVTIKSGGKIWLRKITKE